MFCLVPPLVPLGSSWFHVEVDVVFTTIWISPCLVPLGSDCERYSLYNAWRWFHVEADVLFTTLQMGSTWFHVEAGALCTTL